MACIAIRLWCPESISSSELIHVVNNSIRNLNIAPPFTESLQNIINTMYPDSNRLRAHCFRLTFPRGPVISAESLPLTRIVHTGGFNRSIHNVLFQGTLQGLENNPRFELAHFASSRLPRSLRSDTLIRDIHPNAISRINGFTINRTYNIRRMQRRHVPPSVPSYACTVPTTCAICLNDTAIGETVSKLPCLHEFHKRCITPWLAQNNTCPTCRHEL